MHMEIEKKYLLKALPFDMTAYDRSVLRQGYISTDPVIRLRSEKNRCAAGMSEKYFLTVKGSGTLAREEFELEITRQRFEELWKKIEGYPIDKIRYRVPLEPGQKRNDGVRCDAGCLVAELDEYINRLEGLFTVETEFSSIEEALAFVPPDWFGSDVTEDRRYGNGRMSKEIPPFAGSPMNHDEPEH